MGPRKAKPWRATRAAQRDMGQAIQTERRLVNANLPERLTERLTPIMPLDTRKVNLRLRPPTARDEICAGCWNYGQHFVTEYPFDDWTPVRICNDCKTRSADYRQRDLIIRNAGRFMAIWDWRGSVGAVR